MDEDYKCNSCGTSRPPTEMKDEDGRVYLFCSVCKKELKLEDILDRTVEKQRIDVRINYYYDETKEHAILKMEDWERILKILEEGGAELHRSET